MAAKRTSDRIARAREKIAELERQVEEMLAKEGLKIARIAHEAGLFEHEFTDQEIRAAFDIIVESKRESYHDGQPAAQSAQHPGAEIPQN